MEVVIFPNGTGLTILHSTGVLPISEVARKDVPAGAPYLIVDSSAIPVDRAFRNAWEADFSMPDGYGIGAEAWFLERAAESQWQQDEMEGLA